jgi:hypothetical protein
MISSPLGPGRDTTVRILCALRIEVGKNYQHGLDVGPLEFQSLQTKGMYNQPTQNSATMFWGHTQNTRSHLP